MKRRHCSRILWLMMLISSSPSLGVHMEIKVGPPGAGTGGTNPIGIPPGGADLEINYLSTDNWQYTFSIIPGLLFGKRTYYGDYFGTIGGGLVFTANGAGVGPYVGMGYRAGDPKRLGFVAEFKHAAGYLDRMVSPYALRMGVSHDF